jgi:NAD(P)-dependent dehydrogenase (short-subunit alcohol dehydrogenase family)
MKNHVVYTAAKGGLLALTRALARDLAPEIRVNGVAPGRYCGRTTKPGATRCPASAYQPDGAEAYRGARGHRRHSTIPVRRGPYITGR